MPETINDVGLAIINKYGDDKCLTIRSAGKDYYEHVNNRLKDWRQGSTAKCQIDAIYI